MSRERTFLLIKPEGVRRGLVGEILARFARAGLEMVALKEVRPTRKFLERISPSDDVYLQRFGERALEFYRDSDNDPMKVFGSREPRDVGSVMREWNIRHRLGGDLVVAIFTGESAIKAVRKLIGPTSPLEAPAGTIRGDFSTDSPEAANRRGVACDNIVHASADAEEAEREIADWFGEEPVKSL
ncbi:MAG: nucleoside-diphosphate kinase [bacterium]|nr:nucleoside-diphosphate kinase [bacterium]